ncbi:MAG: GNAT family N-acetyltransferase [Hyphomicrobium sp.]|nr:GNAT family N-acetyltransferase [Hyphomicrobium sp.]
MGVAFIGRSTEPIGAFEVRVARAADEPAVTTLLAACYPALMRGAYGDEILDAALPLITRANPHLLASGTYYVAEAADGALVGCGGVGLARPGAPPGAVEVEPGLAHVRHFATDPAWLRRGVARSIMSRSIAAARRAAATAVECYSSLNAVPFYTVEGFRPVERVDVRLDGTLRFPAVLMRRDI